MQTDSSHSRHTDTNTLTANVSSRSRPKGYKWIAKEIEALDPTQDYARIWALTTIYYADDTLVNLLYAVGMPCFTQSPYGNQLLVRRSQKATDNMHDRAYDTLSHFWLWFEKGPDDIDAQCSVEQVNLIHAAMAKQIPEAFTNDDFIYTTAWLGTYLHRLRILVGLPGFSDKQKLAAHRFWSGIMAQMRGPHGYVYDYPTDFAGMEAFVDEFESRPWASTEEGKILGEYVIKQFNEARLPRPLWGIGKQLILTCQTKSVRDLHQMGDPNPVAAWLIKKALKFKVWSAEKLLPDPKLSAHEQAILKGDVQNQHREPRKVPPSKCPFHANEAKLDKTS